MAYFGKGHFFGLGLLIRAFESSPDAVRIDDTEGTVLYVNDAWTRLFGLSRAEVEGRKYDEVLPEESDAEALSTTWNQCIREGQAVGTLHFDSPGHSPLTGTYSRTLYRNAEGLPTAVITIFRPTTSIG